jgi:hypothetical protein
MVDWFGYWEVWHVVLAMILTLVLMRFYPYSKQRVLLWVLAIALAYELSEVLWNADAYNGWRHQFGNSMKDIIAALIGFSAVIFATMKKRLL